MSKLGNIFNKEKKVVPVSQVIEEARQKLGPDNSATLKLEKMAADFKAGKEVLHIAIESHKNFKVEGDRFFQEEYTVESTRSETLKEVIQGLSFKVKKDQQKYVDALLALVNSPENLEELDKTGHILLGEPSVIEVKAEAPKAIVELYKFTDAIDLSK